MPRRLRLTALLALLALAGCTGASDGDEAEVGKNAENRFGDEKQVAQVVDDLGAASRAGDGKRICSEIFTPALAEKVGATGRTTCVAQVGKQPPGEDPTVQQLEVRGAKATARVRERDGRVSELTFVRDDDAWRIDSIR